MLVQTESLTKRYGALTALDDCTLGVPSGQICGLLGPNGSGKTTLLRLIMGFLHATSGRAAVQGLDCHRDRVRVHALIAYLPGEARTFRNMRGRDVLRFFSQVRAEGDVRRAESIADRLGLDLTRQVARCSTGMRHMLALAVTLSFDCPLLILDEPTANLDPSVRSEVLKLIAEARAAGRTVIFSSHVLPEVEQVCDRVVMLRAGRLVHDQIMAELLRHHRIHARVDGPAPQIPDALNGSISILNQNHGEVTFDAPGEISPLLSWLATLQVSEMRIEPLGLQAIYDRFHKALVP